VWTYTLNNNNAAVQALNNGQTLTDTFTVHTVDGTAQLVTVTINGSNDAAVISGTTTGSVVEAGGVNNGTAGTPTAIGTLTDTDVDNPANSFTAVTAGAATTNGYGSFGMTAAGVWTYTLNNNNAAVQALNSGQTLTDTFTVHTVDGTAQLVTVTINGADDAPVNTVPGTTQSVSKNGTLTFNATNSNQISISDVDNSSATVTLSGTFTGGNFTIHVGSVAGVTITNNDSPTVTLSGTDANINAALNGMTWVPQSGKTGTGTLQISTNDGSLITTSTVNIGVSPAGIAGSPINLALNDASGVGAPTTITVSGMPADWNLSAGTNNGDGTWTVATNDPSALSVTTPTSYSGAIVLNVAESWTNADGTAGSAFVADNVEAYAPGSPIFALSSDDTLTGAGGNDEFVFSQPIGNDTIYNFNVASDTIDLIGFSNVASFSDIQANLTDDANGNAVITIGAGETITLKGVDAASLNAGDFAFDQTPVTTNASSMVISDGAILPLSGVVNNTGTIALDSTGSETDLELIQHGITLQGDGALTLSDTSANVIFGTDPSVTFTNVDNIISGAGQLGEGQMTLVNEGTIDATGANALVVDTGSNVITNSGVLEATGTGGLIVNSAVANSGSLLANSGNLTFNGAVTGNGSATISGAATLEFAAASAENVNFAAGSTGTLKLDDSAAFTGSVSGLTTTTYIDLADLSWAEGQMVASFSGDASGGKLTVSDGTHSDTINLAGDYTQSGWTLSQDSHGNTLVVDPPLASAPNGAGDKSTMLLAQYAAAGFQSGVSGDAGGFTTTPTPEAVLSEPPSLTKPT
jgi:VCBS repeat-containing protein